ncbi:flagellar motor switch protein FliG [Luminiphilus sp.]|nr:flagellar motor switch protein FliG [Luminiphilus sp.]MDB2316405.1 flagellar motor switch protein FliG [Luminiphilus sp.]MDB2378423.1 flagellar motor switch protein FliG [Luminiphilus sp.]MDB2511074.1 flagellar motor switch protein FliG [Luminiphilus sp.]
MANEQNLSGAERAAIFLLGVGEEAATEVMRHMSAKEVQQVGEAMAMISKLTNNQVESVLADFHLESAEINPLGLDAPDFTRRVMTSALGQDKAQNILSQVLEKPEEHNGVEALQWMAPKAIAEVLEEEHPQIAATVMTQLYDEQAAKVLELLSEDMRKDVILRIARMEELDPRAMEELDRVLESQLGKLQRTPPRKVMGPDNLAAILNATGSDLEKEMLEALTSQDEELSDDVKEKMFIFDNLMQLDDRGFQRLVREVPQENLLTALKGVDETLAERFFNNMSERAAEILREDMEASGPVKLADVEVAQKEIVRTAKRLADEGELMIGKAARDYV